MSKLSEKQYDSDREEMKMIKTGKELDGNIELNYMTGYC